MEVTKCNPDAYLALPPAQMTLYNMLVFAWKLFRYLHMHGERVPSRAAAAAAAAAAGAAAPRF